MINKIKRLAAALLIIAVISGPATARAFSFTNISNTAVLWQGTKERPITVSSEEDALSKYMRLRGMSLGKMYYVHADGKDLDMRKLTDILRMAYPFLMSAVCWYEYPDGAPREKLRYVELSFLTPEYVDPAVQKAEEIVAKITDAEQSYIDRIQAIHDYLVDNVEYDWALYAKKPVNARDVGYTAYGALINGKAVCEGYSSAFALMCHAAGIPAYMVIGENKTGSHSWNIVYLYGSFYHVDVTGCDTSGERYRYYLSTEKEIKETHKVDTAANRTLIKSLHNADLPSAQLLSELGLMRGTGGSFDLDRNPSRLDAAVMLTRLAGHEAEAKLSKYAHPFTDVPDWATPYVGYLYRSGLTTGASEALYDGARTAAINDYLTFMLRTLGYGEPGDFTWGTAVAAAERLGLAPQGRYSSGAEITRGEMAAISIQALVTRRADGTYLLDSLIGAGVVDKTRADGLAPYLPPR